MSSEQCGKMASLGLDLAKQQENSQSHEIGFRSIGYLLLGKCRED
jgi:hypothetical protein